MPQQNPLQNFTTAYQKMSDRLAALSLAMATAGGNVDSYTIEGQTISRTTALQELKQLPDMMMNLKRAMAIESGPFEKFSYGVPI